jgi:hypothetical protein
MYPGYHPDQKGVKMSNSRFLKDFFTTFFDTFNSKKPLVQEKSFSSYSPSGTAYQLVSEKILMSFVGALDTTLKAHLGVQNSKPVSKSGPALYYMKNHMQSSHDSTLSAAELLLVDLSEFYGRTAQKLEAIREPMEESSEKLRKDVSALLAKLNNIEISEEIKQKEVVSASSTTRSSSGDFSELRDIDSTLLPGKTIAAFGTFILKKLAEMEKVPTNLFGASNSEVIMKYSQELLSQLKVEAGQLYPSADKKSCLTM